MGEGQLFGLPEVGTLLLPGLPKLADPVSYVIFPVEKLRHSPLLPLQAPYYVTSPIPIWKPTLPAPLHPLSL